jgi:hypothetical protein
MEQFFAPFRRLRDELQPSEFKEVELAVPVEEFLNHRWDWKDLRAFLMDGEMSTIAWITEDSYIWAKDDDSEAFCPLICLERLAAHFTATSGVVESLFLMKRPHNSASVLAGASSIFWHAVTTSNCVALVLKGCSSLCLCSGPALSQSLRASPRLKDLQFADIDFEEDHCRALATLKKTDLEISFWQCTLDTQDAEAVFIEWLRHGQVVTELFGCTMKSSNILSALSGNSSIQILSYDLEDSCRLGNCGVYIHQLAKTLPGNKGLVYLRLSWSLHHLMTDERWCLIFRSLWTHPRIESLNLRGDACVGELSAESKTRRMHAVLQMVRCNTVVHTISFPFRAMEFHQIYQNHIRPRLEMNRSCFEEQRRAIKRLDPSIRGQLLGRALHVVRYNPNLIFRFLSENIPAFVRTENAPSFVRMEEEEEEADASVVPLE